MYLPNRCINEDSASPGRRSKHVLLSAAFQMWQGEFREEGGSQEEQAVRKQ